MLSVFQLPVPTPYPVGPVNVYLVRNEPLTLIDAGPDTDAGKKALREGLKSLGVDIAGIKRVILTHSHPDHCGLAPWISELSGACIYAHPYEMRRMTTHSDQIKERMPFVIESGLPAGEISGVMGQRDKLPQTILEGYPVETLSGGESLAFEKGNLEVLHLPGHAPGHLGLFDSCGGYLFSGDFLLPHITPNPILEPDPDNPASRLPVLEQYFAGLDAVKKLEIRIVWPGHGGVFNDIESVIAEGRRHHQAQFAKIKGVLNGSRKNCYEIAKVIYPYLQGWNVFLGISEIQAHLDYLAGTGDLGGEMKNGVMYYREAGR